MAVLSKMSRFDPDPDPGNFGFEFDFDFDFDAEAGFHFDVGPNHLIAFVPGAVTGLSDIPTIIPMIPVSPTVTSPIVSPNKDMDKTVHPLTHICRTCKVPFATLSALTAHLSRPPHAFPNISCPDCAATFFTFAEAVRHGEAAHNPAPLVQIPRFRDYLEGTSTVSAFAGRVPNHGVALRRLVDLVHEYQTLKTAGFVIEAPMPAKMVQEMRRCQNCGIKLSGKSVKKRDGCLSHPGEYSAMPTLRGWNSEPFAWTCCGATSSGAIGCLSFPEHAAEPDNVVLARLDFSLTPPMSTPLPRRRVHSAVCLDCEMAQAPGGDRILIQVVLLDYFSGEVLINNLVAPDQPVLSYQTRYSGITAAQMTIAIEMGQALNGWRGARDEVWRFVGTDTVVVGHGVHNDLAVLRMAHTRVVDSLLVVPHVKSRSSTLRNLTKCLLGLEVQNGGRSGHDCLEDARAARELVLWACEHPERLERDSEILREEMAEEKAVLEEKRYIARLRKAADRKNVPRARKLAEQVGDSDKMEAEAELPPSKKVQMADQRCLCAQVCPEDVDKTLYSIEEFLESDSDDDKMPWLSTGYINGCSSTGGNQNSSSTVDYNKMPWISTGYINGCSSTGGNQDSSSAIDYIKNEKPHFWELYGLYDLTLIFAPEEWEEHGILGIDETGDFIWAGTNGDVDLDLSSDEDDNEEVGGGNKNQNGGMNSTTDVYSFNGEDEDDYYSLPAQNGHGEGKQVNGIHKAAAVVYSTEYEDTVQECYYTSGNEGDKESDENWGGPQDPVPGDPDDNIKEEEEEGVDYNGVPPAEYRRLEQELFRIVMWMEEGGHDWMQDYEDRWVPDFSDAEVRHEWIREQYWISVFSQEYIEAKNCCDADRFDGMSPDPDEVCLAHYTYLRRQGVPVRPLYPGFRRDDVPEGRFFTKVKPCHLYVPTAIRPTPNSGIELDQPAVPRHARRRNRHGRRGRARRRRRAAAAAAEIPAPDERAASISSVNTLVPEDLALLKPFVATKAAKLAHTLEYLKKYGHRTNSKSKRVHKCLRFQAALMREGWSSPNYEAKYDYMNTAAATECFSSAPADFEIFEDGDDDEDAVGLTMSDPIARSPTPAWADSPGRPRVSTPIATAPRKIGGFAGGTFFFDDEDGTVEALASPVGPAADPPVLVSRTPTPVPTPIAILAPTIPLCGGGHGDTPVPPGFWGAPSYQGYEGHDYDEETKENRAPTPKPASPMSQVGLGRDPLSALIGGGVLNTLHTNAYPSPPLTYSSSSSPLIPIQYTTPTVAACARTSVTQSTDYAEFVNEYNGTEDDETITGDDITETPGTGIIRKRGHGDASSLPPSLPAPKRQKKAVVVANQNLLDDDDGGASKVRIPVVAFNKVNVGMNAMGIVGSAVQKRVDPVDLLDDDGAARIFFPAIASK